MVWLAGYLWVTFLEKIVQFAIGNEEIGSKSTLIECVGRILPDWVLEILHTISVWVHVSVHYFAVFWQKVTSKKP